MCSSFVGFFVPVACCDVLRVLALEVDAWRMLCYSRTKSCDAEVLVSLFGEGLGALAHFESMHGS